MSQEKVDRYKEEKRTEKKSWQKSGLYKYTHG